MEKIHPSSVSFQSPGADWVMPRSFVIGKLKTLSAYACPIHKCTHSAAGGTIQRLYPGFATVCSRSRNDNNAIDRILPLGRLFSYALSPIAPCKQKMRTALHQAGECNPVIAYCNRSRRGEAGHVVRPRTIERAARGGPTTTSVR